MTSLDQAIAQYEQFANVCEHHGLTASQEEFEQLAAWLRELQERRKADSCEGCIHNNGKDYICLICKRHFGDKYVTERRTDADD